MKKTILVTGATGQVGSEVVKALRARGMTARTASREAGKADVRFAYEDAGSFEAALAGAEGAVLIAPPLDPRAAEKLNPFIDSAKAVGVRRIVLISALGVDRSEGAPLRQVELHLIASGVPYTILRPNFFMDNFSTAMAGMIREQNGIFLAAGNGKTSFIAVSDIAGAVAACLADGRVGTEYNLTGGEALDHTEAAAILAAAAGKPVAYYALEEEAMMEGMRGQGMPETAVQYMGVLYAAVRAGYMATVTGDVELLTGNKPVTLAAFAQERAEVWR